MNESAVMFPNFVYIRAVDSGKDSDCPEEEFFKQRRIGGSHSISRQLLSVPVISLVLYTDPNILFWLPEGESVPESTDFTTYQITFLSLTTRIFAKDLRDSCRKFYRSR